MKSWTTREGRAAGGSPITKNKLHNMLTNMVYAGKVRYRGEVYAGEHPAIVEEATWNQVQDTLNRNGRRGGCNVRNKYSALLKGSHRPLAGVAFLCPKVRRTSRSGQGLQTPQAQSQSGCGDRR